MLKVMVFAPHPDDETLGCGGTLLRHREKGDELHWYIASELKDSESDFFKKRLQEIDAVSNVYSFSTIEFGHFVATELDTYSKSELIGSISNAINSVKPDVIYIPYRNDVHSDHAAVFDAVASCTKSFRYPFISKIRAYETLSETEFGLRPDDGGFKPNLFIDITSNFATKIQIMEQYESELGVHPFPRSAKNIEALAILRGATAGVEYAEAFMTLREIES